LHFNLSLKNIPQKLIRKFSTLLEHYIIITSELYLYPSGNILIIKNQLKMANSKNLIGRFVVAKIFVRKNSILSIKEPKYFEIWFCVVSAVKSQGWLLDQMDL